MYENFCGKVGVQI